MKKEEMECRDALPPTPLTLSLASKKATYQPLALANTSAMEFNLIMEGNIDVN